MVKNIEIRLPSFPRGFHLVTREIVAPLQNYIPKGDGIIHLLLKHTSAALTINENADPSVRDDFNAFIDTLVPENNPLYTHTLEGSDDLPAHIKSSIFGCSLSIPVKDGELMLGTWQGIYLCEFRNRGGARLVVASIIS